MKNTQKIRRVQLTINKQDEYSLIGIVSAEPDYKLCLSLNKILNLSLKNISPFKIPGEKGQEIEYSRFSDTNNTPDFTINLISNRSGNFYFLKKLKNIDYIFQVLHPGKMKYSDHYTSKIRDMDSVTAVFSIDPDSIKDKNLQYLTH